MKKTWIDWKQIEKITPEMAYVLGLLWADGYVLMRGKNHGQITMGNIKEDSLYFRVFFEKVGKWTIREIKGNKRKDQMTFCCYDTNFIKWLYEHDYKAKSTISADKILNTIPKSLHQYWFLGLFDGDGCIYINPNGKNYKITIASSINQDWSYLEKLSKELEITYKIKKRVCKNGSGSNFEITSRYGILKFKNYIYNNNIGLPRKRKKFDFIEKLLESQWKKRKDNAGIYKKTNELFEVYEVKTRKYIGIAKTIEAARELRKQKLGF